MNTGQGIPPDIVTLATRLFVTAICKDLETFAGSDPNVIADRSLEHALAFYERLAVAATDRTQSH